MFLLALYTHASQRMRCIYSVIGRSSGMPFVMTPILQLSLHE